MNNIFITMIALGFITACSGSVGSLGGSSGNSSAGGEDTNGSSGGRSSGGFFAKKTPDEVVLEQLIEEPDTRILITAVKEVKVDRYQGGALIKVRGVTDRQGYHDVTLVAVNDGLPDKNGVVTYELKGNAPLEETFQGPTQRSNEVYAGISINAVRMPSIKRIRIIAAQNQITVSR